MPSATADGTRSLPTAMAVNEMTEGRLPGSNTTCESNGADSAVARREISDEELRAGALVSGPSQFGLADAALWCLVFGATGRIEPMALTSELSIRFLRPAQGSYVMPL